jgi:hypothetical protein
MKTLSISSSFLLVLFCVADLFSQNPNCSSLVGTWHNDLRPNQSTLIITSVDTSTGQISGTYQTGSGATGSFPLLGFANQKSPMPDKHSVRVVSFMVRWGNQGSVTSWSGQCEVINNTPTIRTQWNLVRANSDFTWDHILTGADVFTLGKPAQ